MIEAFELLSFQPCYNEEDGIGSGDNCLVDLHFMDDEIFAQAGDSGGSSNSGEVGKVTFEVFFIGEDGHAVGATFDIHICLAGGIEVGIDDAS